MKALGGRVREHVGRVGHHDAPFLGGRQVAVVDADREVGDDPDRLRQARDRRCVEALGMAGQDGVGIGQQFQQLGAGIEPVVRVELGPVVARQPRLHLGRQPAPDDHDRLCAPERFLVSVSP